ncbi:flagellar motor protein MotA [Enterovirga sp. CN4-39]|uniref:flagellar motor protein MotA n=1 Tax=Enterovirga sp. CN4-39 TaxID=3400910 RepID=UPI003C07851E
MLHPTPLQHEARPLSSPRIYLVRMAVFLILVGFLVLILFEPLKRAFFGNPGLNALIGGVLLVGIVLAGRQVIRLFREIRWVNHISGADGRTLARPPILLAPMAALIGDPASRAGLSVTTVRSLLDSISARLDESRELVRYLAGLLVFLGLLGTFWGLIETVNSVGRIIGSLRTGSDAAVLFDELKTSLSAPLAGMGISFSASLFGLAGSLILGFLDLQAGQAQNRFYTELEDWLASATAANAMGAEAAPADPAIAAQAMANLADSIEGLVQNMRSEQKLLREWMETQAARDRDVRALLERFARDRVL